MKPLDCKDLAHVLAHTEPLWERARGRRLFISGGTGFFGTWLTESLLHCNRALDLGLSATILSRDPDAFLHKLPHLAGEPALRFARGDVRDFAFPEEPFDFVVHAAAPTLESTAGAHAERLRTLMGGTRRMLAFAEACCAQSLLFVSSGAVYGKQPEGLSQLTEDYAGAPDCLDPASSYGEGKRVSELMCAHHARQTGLPIAIARCFAFVGPHLPLDEHFAIGNFLGDALAGRPILVRGDGTPMRSYLYAADLAVWLWTMLLRAPEMQETPCAFNVGAGEAICLSDLARKVAEVVNPACTVEIAQEPKDDAPRQQYVPDVTRAETLLGLRAWIGLEEAIRRTTDWHR
ncbi:MAG TPA: NAD-dependent epimerase/dehydratase family protein [Terracidiphilus sp.]|nr:NAD-dependent epimerase/dehydratase family protein [Terracidiphilus sp.]